MYKIMIVEDDPSIRTELKIYLENSLYQVEAISEFTDVSEQIIKSAPDLVLLDVNLPGESGLTICTKVRAVSDVPIIFVTSQNTTADELDCILHGGDDYIAKPYNTQVLLARIAMVLKRAKKDEVPEHMLLTHKGVSLNLQTYKIGYESESNAYCKSDGLSAEGESATEERLFKKSRQQEVELSKTEMKICHRLFLHPDEVVSRMDMIEYLWDNQVYIDDNTLSVNMTRIRSKLESIGIRDFIETKRGLGYKI